MNEGRFLLAEIMQGGNFGQYDTRLGSKENEGKLHRYLRMSLRNLRFAKYYPTEALLSETRGLLQGIQDSTL